MPSRMPEPAPSATAPFVPLREETIQLLSQASTLQVWLALGERALTPAGIARATCLTEDEVMRHVTDLVHAGLVEVGERADPPVFRVRVQNVADLEASTFARVAFRAALLSATSQVLAGARKALRARPETANVGLALVTLPDTPEMLAKALAILAETEVRLRALADAEASTSGPVMRVAMVVGSQ